MVGVAEPAALAEAKAHENEIAAVVEAAVHAEDPAAGVEDEEGAMELDTGWRARSRTCRRAHRWCRRTCVVISRSPRPPPS
jgi:hypothetical protein